MSKTDTRKKTTAKKTAKPKAQKGKPAKAAKIDNTRKLGFRTCRR